MSRPNLPELRQIVLLTEDLERSLRIARTKLGVPHGLRDAEIMRRFGMLHEFVGFERTYIELCQPTDPNTGMGQRILKGECGFMVVLQVADSDAAVARAAELDIKPLSVNKHSGGLTTQWHPRNFGVLVQLDQMEPASSWHLAPAVYDARSTSAIEDMCALTIATAEPAEVAERWASVIGVEVDADGTSLEAGGKTLRFVPATGRPGLKQVDCRCVDRDRVGEQFTLGGVNFLLV